MGMSLPRRPAFVFLRQSGFTLVELLVVVAVVAILAAVAVPSYTQMIANSRVRSTAQTFHASLMRARSEALKRNRSVAVQRIGTSWSNGWQIVDQTSGDVIESSAPATRVTLAEGSNLTTIVYLQSGRMLSSASALFMRFADVGGKAQDRCVAVDLSGRPSIVAEDDKSGDAC